MIINNIMKIKYKDMLEVISFIVSMLSDLVPAIKEKVERNKSLSEKIDDCLMRAIDRWDVTEDLKRSTRLQPIRYKILLKNYIQHPEKGIHPKDKELLKLWTDVILSDGDCSAFVLSFKEDLIQHTQEEGFKNILSGLLELNALQEDIKLNIDKLCSRGGKSINQFWNEVSVFDHGKKLPYSIITSGREQIAEEITKACHTADFVVFEAQSHLEAKAFAAAVILENNISADNVIVVENEDLYAQLTNDDTRKIIITSIPANHQLAVANGHSVIYCIGPQDNYAEVSLVLPEINRDGFISALETSGLNTEKARQFAIDSAKDINMLWRLLDIKPMSPSWKTNESINKFIPIMLVGRWDEMCDGDKQIVAEIAGYESYDRFRKELNNYIYADESPIKRIESVFAIKSSYAIFKRYFKYVTIADIKRFLTFVDIVLDDVDPDAVAKMDSMELKFWRDKRVFSTNLRRGVVEGLTLISIMQENLQQENIIDKWIEEKFKSFDIQKLLSHRNNLLWMAEASPRAFLYFIENDIKQGSPILNELFIIRTDHFGLNGAKIYYAELLRCLECIAWKEDYLPQVTGLLLYMGNYPNESNWQNRPSNSLKNIYRFVLPGTLVPMSKRISILKGLRHLYPEAVHSLSFDWIKGLNDTILDPTSYFRWRWLAQKPEKPRTTKRYPDYKLLREMYELMMVDFTWSEKEVVELLKVSMCEYMHSLREEIISMMHTHIDKIKGNDTICDELRDEIFRHMDHQDTWWAMKLEALQAYKDLLNEITLPDVINANKHYFEDIFVHNPELGVSYLVEDQFEKSLKIQAEIEDKIIQEEGLDGIWKLVDLAKSTEAVANGFTELTEDTHYKLVYERYCDGLLCKEFVKCYYNNLYYKYGSGMYLNYLAELQVISANKISIVLYAPNFHRELADMADSQSESIQIEYWKNVFVWQFGINDVSLIADRLLYCKRYGDLLHFMTRDVALHHLDSSKKANILHTIFQSDDGILVLIHKGYQMAKILNTIDVTGSPELELKIEQIEFYLYKHLDRHLKKEHNHFQRAINSKPEILMEIVAAIHDVYSDSEESISLDDMSSRQFKTQVTYEFWHRYHDVPCTDMDGKIDETKLRDYLVRLKELAKEYDQEDVLPLAIGKILGNFQEDDDYPCELLCSLVEEYANDRIDNIIGCEMHNRRSFSTRSPFDGGTVERHHIATLRKYRDNAIMRSPRFVKILDDVIRSFEYSAKRNDFEGKMNNFNY